MMFKKIFLIFLCFILFVCVQSQFDEDLGIPECVDPYGNAKFCRPPFNNAAYGRRVNATNTCGLNSSQQFCGQSGASGLQRVCDVCDDSNPRKRHPASYITDYNFIGSRKTWWQSDTLNEYVTSSTKFNYLNGFPINLTINLGTQFELTYIRIKFQSVRPSSMVLYRKYDDSSPWEPLQYFSASCSNVFKMRDRSYIDYDDQAICVSKYSSLTPLSDGEVVFSFLEGRPGSTNFFKNKKLQRWVTASQIRVALIHMNTFGDELYRDPRVLRTYYYAISDISIGGRCHCNGHAARCAISTGAGSEEAKLYCDCEHNTEGQNCERCRRGFEDVRWSRATPRNAHACKPCNCNGNSKNCYFDKALFDFSGGKSGGHCINCKNNTEGPHCEFCKAGFNRTTTSRVCLPCNCNKIGSKSNECDQKGQCKCLPGVTGKKCDRCSRAHFDFTAAGCRSCNCSVAGSPFNKARCHDVTGVCRCKENVEGKQCDRCLPGYFDLSLQDPLGCQPCFCYGHSSQCTAANGWLKQDIHVPISSPDWKIVDSLGQPYEKASDSDAEARTLGLPEFLSPTPQWEDGLLRKTLYYSVPDAYLGDRRSSYNRFLVVKLSFDSITNVRFGFGDIRVASGLQEIGIPLLYQQNPDPVPNKVMTYRFRLNENANYEWTPKGFSVQQWVGLLNQVTSIRIKATYADTFYGNTTGRARLHGVWLEGAAIPADTAPANSSLEAASSVELCDCPAGHEGQFCEACTKGYRREDVNGGPFSRCVPCACNNHSDACDVETAECYCQHNTTGDACERCLPGFYGNPSSGLPDACQPCPCPKGHACMKDPTTKEMICLSCPDGYTGPRCDRCLDGFFGRPPSQPCQPCECNDNIDPNAVGNCDHVTGKCLRCINDTAGPQCERCADGFYGNATATFSDKCRSCNCHPTGSETASCDQLTGQCLCRPNVEGQQCDKCERGFYNLQSSFGCLPCLCNAIGTLPVAANSSRDECDLKTGQCPCRPGVGGRRCNACASGHFNFTKEGCAPCLCDPEGSLDAACDPATGRCRCRPNVQGARCDECGLNRFDFAKGCKECPQCYGRIMKQVTRFQENWRLVRASTSPEFSNASLVRLEEVSQRVSELYQAATNRANATGDKEDNLLQELRALRTAVGNLRPWEESAQEVEEQMDTCNGTDLREELSLLLDNITAELTTVTVEGQRVLNESAAEMKKSGGNNSSSEEMTELSRAARNITTQQKLELQRLRQRQEDLAARIAAFDEQLQSLPDISQNASERLSGLQEALNAVLLNASGTALSEVINATTALLQKALALSVAVEKLDESPANPLRAQVLLSAFKKTFDEGERLLNEAEQIVANAANGTDARFNATATLARSMLGSAQEELTQQRADLAQLRESTRNDSAEMARIQRQLKEIHNSLTVGIDEGKRRAQVALQEILTVRASIDDLEQNLRNISSYLSNASAAEQMVQDTLGGLLTNLSRLRADFAEDKPAAVEAWKTANATRGAAVKLAKWAAGASLNATEAEMDELRRKTAALAEASSADKANVTDHSDALKAGLEELMSLMRQMEEGLESNETLWEQWEERVRAVEQNMTKPAERLDEKMTELDEETKRITEATNRLQMDLEKVTRERDLLSSIANQIGNCQQPSRVWIAGVKAEE